MTSSPNRRQKTAALVFGIALLVLFVALGSETAFNLNFLHPHGAAQVAVFAGLSLAAFLLLITLLILLTRNILKLYADQKSRALGSRLRTRMMLGALLLSFAPVVTMFLFSYILMNRSIDRWFSQPVTSLHEDANGMAQQLQYYAAENARAEADSLSQEPGIAAAVAANAAGSTRDAMIAAFRDHKVTLQGGFVLLFRNGALLSSYQAPVPRGPVTVLVNDRMEPASQTSEDFAQTLLHIAQRTDQPVLCISMGPHSEPVPYVVSQAPVHGGSIIVVGLPLPQGLPTTIQRIREGTADYFALGRARRGVRSAFLLVLVLLTTAIFFASSWLALFLSKQITRPIESLADAMSEMAMGNYGFRLQPIATNELGQLAASFNLMAADLETSRNRLDSSRTDLSRANQALDARRVEIETLLDTIPLAVLSLSLDFKIVHSNRAFVDLLAPNSPAEVYGHHLSELIPEEAMREVQRLLRRAHRMGLASKEIELHGPTRLLNLSVIAASLERRGYILVMEDITDLLRAQKQVAWKEVAQRVAHEIKNPLTPVSIAAERILRYADRDTLQANSETVRDSAGVILRSVEVMRQLVDEFSLLARFPASLLRPVDLNQIVQDTLTLFDGRVEEVRIIRRLDVPLPPVMADPMLLQRAFANLMENAIEAMQHSFVRELTVETSIAPSGTAAEIIIADTGPGLPEEMREHLFLPWVSTKQRGSGLGLAITSQVVQEHHGSIRVEKNLPTGAKFIIELPLAETRHNGEAQPRATETAPA